MHSKKAHHVVPRSNDRLHIQIAGKESNNTIGDNLAILDQNTTKIPDYAWIVADLKSTADRNLIGSSCDYEWKETVTG
jgi:hypothetical protein